MNTDINSNSRAALNAAKESLSEAGTALKDEFQNLKDQAAAKKDEIMENNPDLRAKADKAADLLNKVKGKAADLLRSGAEGARNLADKLDK